MPPETSDSFSKMVLILFGWVLGLLAPAIVDLNRKIRDAKEIRTAIKVELIELQYRLALSAYHLDGRYGEIDKDHIALLKKILDRYEGVNKKDKIKNLIDLLSIAKDEELKAFSASQRAESDGASLLKKYPVPFLDSKISSLAWVNEKLRNQILEVKANLNMLDETIDDSRFYFNLTFQKITNENHEKACRGVIESYKHYSSRAKTICALIEKMSLK